MSARTAWSASRLLWISLMMAFTFSVLPATGCQRGQEECTNILCSLLPNRKACQEFDLAFLFRTICLIGFFGAIGTTGCRFGAAHGVSGLYSACTIASAIAEVVA